MALNIGIDYVVGSIPVVGDAFDFVWKSNKKNMNLLRTRATGKGKGTTGDYIFIGVLIFGLIAILLGSILASLYILYLIFGGNR